MKTIEVQYPTTIVEVINTEAEMRAKGYKNYKGDQVRHNPVNRIHSITVKQTARIIEETFRSAEDARKELETICLNQTGLTPVAYQAKFKRAWND